MNLVTVEKAMPRRRAAGTRGRGLTPEVARAMQRTMSMVPSAMPLLYGGGDPFEFWQPTAVSGFCLDINPHYNVTTESSLGSPHVTQIVNHAPSTSDAFAQSNSSLKPAFEASGWGGQWGRPSMLFDGVGQYLVCTTSLANALVGGTDTPFAVFIVGKFVTTPTGVNISNPFFIGRSSSSNPLWDFSANSSTYKAFKRPDTGGSGVNLPGGTPDTSKHVFENVHGVGTLTGRVDGSSIYSGSFSVGALTVDRVALGATYANSSPANFSNFRLARLLAFTGAMASQDATDVRAALTAMYL